MIDVLYLCRASTWSAERRDLILSADPSISVLGVDADTAQQAACRAEHALGPEIIGRLLSFIEYVTESHKNGYDVADEFQRFYQKHSVRKTEVVKQ